ncbi:MAG: hypothetical protein ACRCYX_02415 [Dermatophilaceae bacterium]
MKSPFSRASTGRGSAIRIALLTILVFGAVSATGATAQAQPGSRLCGHFYQKNGHWFASIIEVPKGNQAVCDVAQDVSDEVAVAHGWTNVRDIYLSTCEDVAAAMYYPRDPSPCHKLKRADDTREAGQAIPVLMGIGYIVPVHQPYD